MAERIEFTTEEPQPPVKKTCKLVVLTEGAPSRDATPADLKRAGWFSREEMPAVESESASLRARLAVVEGERDEYKIGCNVRDEQLKRLDAALGLPTFASWSELAEAGEKLRSDLAQAREELAALREVATEVVDNASAHCGVDDLVRCGLIAKLRGQLSALPGTEAKATGKCMSGKCAECNADAAARGLPVPATPEPPAAPPAASSDVVHLGTHTQHAIRLVSKGQAPSEPVEGFERDQESGYLFPVAPSEASPLPWRTDEPMARKVLDNSGRLVADCQDSADARYIVASVNARTGAEVARWLVVNRQGDCCGLFKAKEEATRAHEQLTDGYPEGAPFQLLACVNAERLSRGEGGE